MKAERYVQFFMGSSLQEIVRSDAEVLPNFRCIEAMSGVV